ncbi:MAG: universal stress protein [Halodesulfurarchaeum sp.]
MTDRSDPPTRDLLEHVLLPVANRDDAEASAAALEPYAPERVSALHVVEKGEGVPDKTPVEQSERIAEASFAAIREAFPGAETHTDYARDVVEAIIRAAAGIDASAIAFHSRGGSRLVQFLSGDRTLRLVTDADRPVISLPDPDQEG